VLYALAALYADWPPGDNLQLAIATLGSVLCGLIVGRWPAVLLACVWLLWPTGPELAADYEFNTAGKLMFAAMNALVAAILIGLGVAIHQFADGRRN